MLKPKVGDLVRLKPMPVTNINENNGSILVKWKGAGRAHWIVPEQIEEILPRPLAVGDLVRWRSPGTAVTGSVKAIHGDWVWVFWAGVGWDTVETHRLTRIDDAP